MNFVLLKIVAALALLGVVGYGVYRVDQGGYNRARIEDVAETEALKRQAAEALAAEVIKTAKAQAELSTIIAKLETDRETEQLKNRADLRTRAAGPRLQFVAQAIGCRGGGGNAKAGALGPSGDARASLIQLPEPLNGNLWGYAADAQSLAIDYGVLYRYLHNPKLVCTLQD